jgi:plastocyanin
MRVTWIGAVLAITAMACGKKEQAPSSESAAQPAAETQPATQPTGPVVEVQMTGVGNVFKFEPDKITVPAGGTVKFINVSGGPHNVTFWPDSVPAGVVDKLNAAMPNRMDNLSGPFLVTPNETYEISFAGLPAGVYKGYCTPHLALGMTFVLTLQ